MVTVTTEIKLSAGDSEKEKPAGLKDLLDIGTKEKKEPKIQLLLLSTNIYFSYSLYEGLC